MRSSGKTDNPKWKIMVAVLAVALHGVLAVDGECPDELTAKCDLCNQDNYCIKCKRGFYLEPIPNSQDGGHCIHCTVNCLECEAKDRCTQCQIGFVNYPDYCTPCESGCAACLGRPTNCTDCEAHFKLDSLGECYFRYTLLIELGVGVGILSLLFLTYKLMNYILKGAKRSKRSSRENHESILGDEYKIDPTFITDVTGIGRHTEIDKQDLSLVAEEGVDGPNNDDSIHSIRDVFDENETNKAQPKQKRRKSSSKKESIG